MARYRCTVCGYVYDEEEKGVPFSELTACPVCKQPVSVFEKIEEDTPAKSVSPSKTEDLAYDAAFARKDPTARYMAEIHEMAVSGERIDAAMGTLKPMPDWDDILLLGNQLNPPPLEEEARPSLRTVIGKNAKSPWSSRVRYIFHTCLSGHYPRK